MNRCTFCGNVDDTTLRNVNGYEVLESCETCAEQIVGDTEEEEEEPKFDVVGFIIDYETGMIDDEDELIEGFQALIDSGMVWTLQGHYGRTAKALIEGGHCKEASAQ